MPNSNHLYRFSLLLLLLLGGLSACNEQPTDQSVNLPTEAADVVEEEPKSDIYIIPGDYYEMMLGLDGDIITGVYITPESNTETPCFFFFEGRIAKKNPIKVECYDPLSATPPISGSFKIMGQEMFVRLSQKPMTTCTPELSDDIGRPLVLDLQHDWKAIRVIEKDQTPIFEDAMEGLELGDRVPRGTIIAVKEIRGEWLRVDVPAYDYADGWIKKSYLFPLLDLG